MAMITGKIIQFVKAVAMDAEKETQGIASLQPKTTQNNINKFEEQSKSLASLIRGFKTGVSVNARKINPNFAWQTRFHDHIIRNE